MPESSECRTFMCLVFRCSIFKLQPFISPISPMKYFSTNIFQPFLFKLFSNLNLFWFWKTDRGSTDKISMGCFSIRSLLNKLMFLFLFWLALSLNLMRTKQTGIESRIKASAYPELNLSLSLFLSPPLSLPLSLSPFFYFR